jgi:geranylgeranyl diphosphate synthase, type II
MASDVHAGAGARFVRRWPAWNVACQTARHLLPGIRMLQHDTATQVTPLFDRALVEAVHHRLGTLLPLPHGGADPLCDAMRHALLGPGKRVRAVLTVLAGRELGGPDASVLAAGCALEMLHAASLVVDDLPAMDDAQLRRGRAATHVAHGEALATLAAIGLIARAFGVVSGLTELNGQARSAMAASLARAIGPEGLCGGQMGDLDAGPSMLQIDTLNQIGNRKTAVLFVAAVELAGAAAGASAARLARLRLYAQHLGLAFQICDDLADDGEDGARPTYVRLLGRSGAEALLRQHVDSARAQLSQARGPLGRLLDVVFERHLARVAAFP